MTTKIIYQTQWVAKDPTKEYPHGWGFDKPLIEFPQDADPAWCSEMAKELSNDEFTCIGAVPTTLIDNTKPEFWYPICKEEYVEWKKNRGKVLQP